MKRKKNLVDGTTEHILNRWKGQIRLFGEDAESLPPKIIFYGIETRLDETITHRFVVTGHTYDLDFDTSFRFHKAFESEEDADAFFQAFKLRYPCSEMELRENKLSTLKSYY